MPRVRKTHQQCRKLVCFSCLQKARQTASSESKKMIEEHWLPNVDWDNDRIPCGLCHHCRQQLIQISDGIIDSPTLLYEFSDIVLPVLTSDRPNCTCQICLIIHPGGLNNEKQFPHDLPRKNGRPRKDDSEPEISFIGTPHTKQQTTKSHVLLLE
jgi:hypothetical protein